MVDWGMHKRHREQVAADEGVYLGLLDENWEPLCDLPSSAVVSTTVKRSDVSECVVSYRVGTPPHPSIEHVLAERLLDVDAGGELVMATRRWRWLLIQWPEERHAYRVIVPKGDNAAGEHPLTVELRAVDCMDYALGGFPCVSVPGSWDGQWREFPRDEATVFKTARRMAPILLGERADGFTVHGPAVPTIRNLIDRSLQACFHTAGINSNPPVVVSTAGGDGGGDVFITPQDGPLLDELKPVVQAAGVRLGAELWLPGDAPVPGHQLTLPTVVVTVTATET